MKYTALFAILLITATLCGDHELDPEGMKTVSYQMVDSEEDSSQASTWYTAGTEPEEGNWCNPEVWHEQSPVNVVQLETAHMSHGEGAYTDGMGGFYEDGETAQENGDDVRVAYFNLNNTVGAFFLEQALSANLQNARGEEQHYDVSRIQFHSPAEHTFDGVQYDVEMQMVMYASGMMAGAFSQEEGEEDLDGYTSFLNCMATAQEPQDPEVSQEEQQAAEQACRVAVYRDTAIVSFFFDHTVANDGVESLLDEFVNQTQWASEPAVVAEEFVQIFGFGEDDEETVEEAPANGTEQVEEAPANGTEQGPPPPAQCCPPECEGDNCPEPCVGEDCPECGGDNPMPTCPEKGDDNLGKSPRNNNETNNNETQEGSQEEQSSDNETATLVKKTNPFGANNYKTLHKADTEVDAETETEVTQDEEEGSSICAEEDFTCSELDFSTFLSQLTDNNGVYFYEGSNTVPPCAQNVNWYLVQQVYDISEENVAVFANWWQRKTFNNDHIQSRGGRAGNNRQVQDLGNRTVTQGSISFWREYTVAVSSHASGENYINWSESSASLQTAMGRDGTFQSASVDPMTTESL